MVDEPQRWREYPTRASRPAVPGVALGKGLLIVLGVLAIPAYIAVYISAEDFVRQQASRTGQAVPASVHDAIASTVSAIRLDAVMGISASVVLLALAFAIDTYPTAALLSGTFVYLSRFASFVLASSSMPYRWPLLFGSSAIAVTLLACAVRVVLASHRETSDDVEADQPRVPDRAHIVLQVAYVLVIATPVTTLLVMMESSPGPREPLDFLVLSALNSVILTVIVLGTMMAVRLPKLPRLTQDARRVWTLAPLAVCLLAAVGLAYQYLLSRLLPELANGQAMQEHAHLLLGWIIVGCAMPALLEEWLFRRLAIATFRSLMSVPSAILVSSVMFASVHVMSPLNTPIFFLLGLVLGWSHVQTGRLVLPILLHFCFNIALLAISVS